MNIEFLSTKFIEDYVKNNPKPLNELGEFVYYRTYSRWLDGRGRREYWHETVKRAIEYNMALAYKHLVELGLQLDLKAMRDEAKELFKNIYNAKQFPSGRTLWIGNANPKVNKDFVLGNFNCSFTNVEKWDDLAELFYLLMVGTGVGFKSTKKMASKMPKIRINTTLSHSEYKPVAVEQRLEDTEIRVLPNGYAKILIGDSKNGWVDALREYFKLLTDEEFEYIHTIKISYNSVRPKGERLKTFGGSASGHEPLKEMFEGIDKVLKNMIDPSLKPIEADEKGYGQVRPIHILDIGNLIGNNVVVGGVRRTAEIFLFDSDDYEVLLAKYGINGFWSEKNFESHGRVLKLLKENNIEIPEFVNEFSVKQHGVSYKVEKEEGKKENKTAYFSGEEEARAFAEKVSGHYMYPVHEPRKGVNHRRMSNNSVAFTEKPSRKKHSLQFAILRGEGEPAFVNLEEAARRIAKALGIKNPSKKWLENTMEKIGLNPCVEIILFSKNVCNLTTVNVRAFVTEDRKLDLEGILKAQRLSSRIGLRMTLATLELSNWDKIQKRDRLLGCSLTGWKDAIDILGYTKEQEDELKELLHKVAREEADLYSKQLRVNAPLLVTAVKPEGTLSQVAGGVSSGLHWSHSSSYIRRIRINSTDPLVNVARDLGWTIHAEVGTEFNGEEIYDVNQLASQEVIDVARTVVIDFPVESGVNRTKDDISVSEQFDNYFSFQDKYTEHNTSNTITVKDDEWEEAEQIVWEGWDNFVGVSFLAHDGGTYTLAPYQSCTEEELEKLKVSMKSFDAMLLRKYEKSEVEADVENMESCESGVCPIR